MATCRRIAEDLERGHGQHALGAATAVVGAVGVLPADPQRALHDGVAGDLRESLHTADDAAVVDDLELLGAQLPVDHPVSSGLDLDLVVGVAGDQHPLEERGQEQCHRGRRARVEGLPGHQRIRQFPEVRLDHVQRQAERVGRLAQSSLDLVREAGLVGRARHKVEAADEDQVGDVRVSEDGRPGVDAAAEEGGDPAGRRRLGPANGRDDLHLPQRQGVELPIRAAGPGTVNCLELTLGPQHPGADRVGHRQRPPRSAWPASGRRRAPPRPPASPWSTNETRCVG